MLSADYFDALVDSTRLSDSACGSICADASPGTSTLADSARTRMCADCACALELVLGGLVCPRCGLFVDAVDVSINSTRNTRTAPIKVSTGAAKGRWYNATDDYTRVQRKLILDQLLDRARVYTGPAFPQSILVAAANQYHHMQRTITEDSKCTPAHTDATELPINAPACMLMPAPAAGPATGPAKKKFVRRGSIKDELLAALIYFECIREGIVRKKKDIAKFMGLATNGFAHGEDTLRAFEARGLIDIPVNEMPIHGFVHRYLAALGPAMYYGVSTAAGAMAADGVIANSSVGTLCILDSLNAPPAIRDSTHALPFDPNAREQQYARLVNFITDLVALSESARVGMSSQISSKVVGAIWLLICGLQIGITAAQLEQAADCTKKNTFVKFSRAVMNNLTIFKPVFDAHSVPPPISL